MNIHVLRAVFLKLVGKLACNARLPAYIFCCKELTKKKLQTLLIRRFERRQTHCCIDLKLTLTFNLVTLCSSILENTYFIKYSSKRWGNKCYLHERITYLRRCTMVDKVFCLLGFDFCFPCHGPANLWREGQSLNRASFL